MKTVQECDRRLWPDSSFFEEIENRVVDFRAEAVEGLQLSREKAGAKGREIGPELFVQGGLAPCGGCEAHQRQKDLLVGQPLTDAVV